MREALRLAEEGLAAGDQPIGAIVALDGEVVAAARWRLGRGRMLDHAEVVALRAADADPRVHGRRREATLYTTLEPCLMCMGAAMSFPVARVVYALEAPVDGASEIAEIWQPDLGHPPERVPIYGVPEVVGGVLREESLALAVAFADQHPELAWAQAFVPGLGYPSD
jgi:tRNA(adenine34) deaminase